LIFGCHPISRAYSVLRPQYREVKINNRLAAVPLTMLLQRRRAIQTPPTIVVILGNGAEEIYHARATHALQVHQTLGSFQLALDENHSTILLAKFYQQIPKAYFEGWMVNPSQLWSDEQSKIYRISKDNTFDTITEAAGCRCLVEQKYLAMLERDSDFRIHIVVVTSACHEERTRWIFSEVFNDAAWISISYDSSRSTVAEADRDEKEKALLLKQKELVGPFGNIPKFLNSKREIEAARYKFEFLERTPIEAVIFRSQYCVIHHP